jgi:carboxyl-terminal processing protease
MRGFCIGLAASIFWFATVTQDAAGRPADLDLHELVMSVAQILQQSHYSQKELTPALGKQILETYLNNLDPDHLYLTQQDTEEIRSRYGSGLSDDILLGNLTPAKSIFAIFRQRVDARLSGIDDLLRGHYDFNSDRAIIFNRVKEPWPANMAEADAVWRDRIANELLSAKLNGSRSKQAIESIRNHYRDLQSEIDGADTEEVLRMFLEAVAQTYDPHTEYLGAADLNEFKIDTRLTISGIGAEIRLKDGYATIDRIFSHGPADLSRKLHVGDKIVAVAEGTGPFVDVRHSDLDHITQMVLGKDGSEVRLKVFGSGTATKSVPRVVRLVRQDVRLSEEEAQAEVIEMHSANGIQKLGWISIPSFYGEPDDTATGMSVTRDVAALLRRLNKERIKGLVVDLRNNGGGSVDEALRTIGLFINQGPIVQMRDPSGVIHIARERPGNQLYDGPLIVLNNKLTASASEIFAAAMQDYRRAVIVGDSSTFGKGTVQAVIDLNRFGDGVDNLPEASGAVKVTIEKMYRTTGEALQLKGVVSDLRIPSLSESSASAERDMEHRLSYDQIKPVSYDVAANGKTLFLDELRRRSLVRMRGDLLLQDIAAELALTDESTRDNRVSLNEHVRRSELAKEARLRSKMEHDEKVVGAHNHNKYYELTLADVSERELRPVSNGQESDASDQSDEMECWLPSSPDLSLLGPGKSEIETAAENGAVTNEALNILSDLVSLTGARQVAVNRPMSEVRPADNSSRMPAAQSE